MIYYVAASVDGYIATRDGAVDWLAPFHTAGLRLIRASSLPSGVVELRYRVADPEPVDDSGG